MRNKLCAQDWAHKAVILTQLSVILMCPKFQDATHASMRPSTGLLLHSVPQNTWLCHSTAGSGYGKTQSHIRILCSKDCPQMRGMTKMKHAKGFHSIASHTTSDFWHFDCCVVQCQTTRKKHLKMRENATTCNTHNFHQNSHNTEQRSANNIRTGDNYIGFGAPKGSSTPP
jgi:hypothetical protein